MKKRKQIWLLLAAVVAGAATCYVFRGILRDPARIVHELGGDGIKNYYSFVYHSMYGKGWWFNGMNYPYGEHIMFVDGQPILTVTLSYLRPWLQFTPDTLNVILNLLIALAFFLGIVYIYKILARYAVPPLWAALFAPLIIVVSMQNFRIFGLYGLSYACVVPMTFYWFIRYHESSAGRYMLYLAALACIVMFLHPYQFALILIWSVLYITGYWLLTSGLRRKKFRHVLPVALVLLFTTILLKSALAFTDPITDRPEYPHGLLSYGTTGIDIFTNAHSPYWAWLQSKGIVNGPIGGDAQSYAYTGVVATLVVSVAIITLLVLLLRRRPASARYFLNGLGPVWLFIAAGALLFSMGVPFVWGMDWAFDYISVLRQFRSLGWFALLFYYVVTVMAVVVIFRVTHSLEGSGQWLRLIIIATLFFIWGFEGFAIGKKLYERSTQGSYNYDFFYSNLEKKWPEFLNEHKFERTDFQAILYIPYYHVGSEKIWLARSNWGFCVTMKAAFQLQLPMVDANMSRSSWTQMLRQVKIVGGPYAYKPLIHEAKDKRPFLLLRFEGEDLTPDERYLFQHADSIGVNSNLVAYALYPHQLAAFETKEWQRLRNTGSTDSASYYVPFSDGGNTKVLFGRGAAKPIMSGDTTLAEINVRSWPAGIEYECSAWFLVNSKDYRTPSLQVKWFDTLGREMSVAYAKCDDAKDASGMWFRASQFFRMPEGCGLMQLRLNEKDCVYHGMDEIMIRATKDTIVMRDGTGKVMVNNHLLQGL